MTLAQSQGEPRIQDEIQLRKRSRRTLVGKVPRAKVAFRTADVIAARLRSGFAEFISVIEPNIVRKPVRLAAPELQELPLASATRRELVPEPSPKSLQHNLQELTPA